MKPTIDITAILSPDLIYRSTVSDLLLYIQSMKVTTVIIDFASVKFATRSFIDEFYNIFLKNTTISPKIELKNVPNDIQIMLQTVSNTQTKKKNIANTGRVIQCKTIKEVQEALSMLAF